MQRSAALATAWRRLTTDAGIDDPVGLPGTGLIAFGALAFDERSAADSVLVIPSEVLGRHGDRFWRTTIRYADADTPAAAVEQPYGPHWAGTVGPGAQSPQSYQDAVRGALSRIADRELSKVVLARDLPGSIPAGSDLRRLVRALSTGYPDTWAFAVDGLIGASPETLVTVQKRTVTARVLAGTIGRGADADADTAASTHLASSAKDLDEHQYAVQSVLASLRPHTRALAASEQPFLLRLPNRFIWRPTSRESSPTADPRSTSWAPCIRRPPSPAPRRPPRSRRSASSSRSTAGAMPGRSAGSTPRATASGRSALRCAQFSPGDGRIDVTAYAGAGIVAGSDPESELLETRVKFRPLVDALA